MNNEVSESKLEGLMIASRFSVEEQNLICMYKKDNRLDTMKAMYLSKNYTDDEEMKLLIDEAIYKLIMLKQREYDIAIFSSTFGPVSRFSTK